LHIFWELTRLTVGVGDNDELVTIAEAARRSGVSRQVLTKQVNEFEAGGHLQVKKDGRKRLVDFDALAKLRSQMLDPVQQSRSPGQAAAKNTPAPDSYQSVRTERERAELQRAQIKLAKEQGQVRDIDEVNAAVIDCGKLISRQWMMLPQFADELAVIGDKAGSDGVRKRLKQIAQSGLQEISDELAKLVAPDISGYKGGN
jgi:hypothetical protein